MKSPTKTITLILLGVLLSGSEPKAVFAAPDPPPQKSVQAEDKVRSKENFTEIRHTVETLRGKKFKKEVPVFNVSQKYLRSISDHDLEKDYPGAKLHQYEMLLAWVGLLPPNSNLKAAFANFFAEELAGLYDSDTKEMCIPFPERDTSARAKPAEKKLASVSTEMDELVLAHEFTHALEDQYWPLDVPEDNDTKVSTDRGTAHEFVSEGSAMREMIEAVPAQLADSSPSGYFLAWNVLHSGVGESLLGYVLQNAWKSEDVLADNVPDEIARMESMPYSFGYTFCTEIMRKWGLDGLDYIYEHPPISSEQVMHPRKAWEWRDFPVQIDLPESFKTWTQKSIDTIGEAGIAVFFGSQFTNVNYGSYLARGWDGDHAALYESREKKHLMVWASAWDSTNAAGRFQNAFLNERQKANGAITKHGSGGAISWTRPDGQVGSAVRDGKNLVLIESDEPKSLEYYRDFVGEIRFTQPSQDAERAGLNSPVRRFNPFWAVQQDADYKITRSLGGLLSRHDRNSVGAADTIACGLIGESRRTKSFHKWQIGAGLLARHESEERRGFSHTTLLPLGVLASRSSATLPQAPEKTIGRCTILWGFGATSTRQASGVDTLNILPFGVVVHVANGNNQHSLHILGTGVTRTTAAHRNTKIFRLFGIPITRVSA